MAAGDEAAAARATAGGGVLLGGEAAGATALAAGGTAEVAGGAALASTSTLISAAVITAVPLVMGIMGLIKTGGQDSAITYAQAQQNEKDNPQGSVGLGGLVSPIALGPNAGEGAFPTQAQYQQYLTSHPLASAPPPSTVFGEPVGAAPVAPNLGETSTNVAELSKATGLAQENVMTLASALKINLAQALSPGQIAQFVGYVAQAGGAAAVTGQQWQTASENIQASLAAMANKAAVNMPDITVAARNMVVSTQPQLLSLVTNLNNTGDRAGASWVTAFVAHLSPAQLARQMT